MFSRDIEIVLSNRRFRKAYEDLQKTDRKTAAALLTQNINENIDVLRAMLKSDKEMETLGKYNDYAFAYPDESSYRQSSDPSEPPTRYGRRYAVFAYILLASLLELEEVRPAIEDVICHAQDEYRHINTPPSDKQMLADFTEYGGMKIGYFDLSIYNPSLLLTGTLCDPNWNTARRKLLDGKLEKNRDVVDWESRFLEHDRDAYVGLLPAKEYKELITIRYYKGITDDELETFCNGM